MVHLCPTVESIIIDEIEGDVDHIFARISFTLICCFCYNVWVTMRRVGNHCTTTTDKSS